MNYIEDPQLGKGFEMLRMPQPNDYEGSVTSTLIHYKGSRQNDNAILYIHGFNDYFFQREMAEKFYDKNIEFYALDLRKYGRSWEAHQSFNGVRSLKEYDKDIESALRIIGTARMKKIVLMGHSTGGLIATYYMVRKGRSGKICGVICNSPFYNFNLPKIQKIFLPIISFFGRIFPNAQLPVSPFSPLYGISLHKSEKGEWDYDLRLKPHEPKETKLSFVSAIYRAQRYLRHHRMIQVPFLILCSERSSRPEEWCEEVKNTDIILDVNDIKSYGKKLLGDVTIESFKGGIHDLVLSSSDVRDKVYETIFNWIHKTV